MPLDYDRAQDTLERLFAEAEESVLQGARPAIDENLILTFETVFNSRTQAYREALLGCALARLQDQTIDIRCRTFTKDPQRLTVALLTNGWLTRFSAGTESQVPGGGAVVPYPPNRS